MTTSILRQRRVGDAALKINAGVAESLHPPARSPKSCQDGDAAGGLNRNITLSAPGWLPSFCCSIPGLLLFPMIGVIVYSFFFSEAAFYAITTALTACTICYSLNMCVGCAVGAFRLRQDVKKDWHAMVKQLEAECPEVADCMHLVILPNYKEDEDMLQHTLENLGSSPEARWNMYVVLAMEAREGPEGKQKADNLVKKTSHLFAGVIASYHPVGLPGDVPGKSSNAQWGYHEALRQFSRQVVQVPASRVFVTVGDSDTLFHPQYFSAMVYQAFHLDEEERNWSIWQSPMMLLRNLDSVPAPTRATAYATFLYELSGITSQQFGHHCCHSSYSMTLALTSHPFVGGWDRDVIAEDHHMFCKCYFASIWEALRSPCHSHQLSAGSQVRLRPVYLPALGYTVESDKGWLASIYARIQQARRHSQGIAEISYVFLQYFKVVATVGFFNLPFRVHRGTWCIAIKMLLIHFLNQLQALAITLATGAVAWTFLGWLMSNGLRSLATSVVAWQLPSGSGEVLAWAIPAIFGPVPPIGITMTAVTFLVVKDFMEGKLGGHLERPGDARPFKGNGSDLGWSRSLVLLMKITNDWLGMSFITLIFYGLIPAILAAWSLLRQGTKFEYIVAAKPS